MSSIGEASATEANTRQAVRPPTPVPVRGTQSLVAVMAFVWRNPSLTAMEILWRWCAAIPLLWLGWHALYPALSRIPIDTAGLQSMTFFDPVRSAAILTRQVRLFLPPLEHVLPWFAPLVLIVWALAAAVGRTAVLRRAEAGLAARIPLLGVFALVRALLFQGVLGLWLVGVFAGARATVINPGRHGAEPNLVLFTALVVALTLVLFLAWSLLVWILELPPLVAMAGLGGASRALRSKLIETNLVMGIVKVALLVLAMVFSASPLPFQTQETQGFITVWWIGVGVFYLVSSDFFHVVRRVTYLRLLQTVASETNAAPPPAS